MSNKSRSRKKRENELSKFILALSNLSKAAQKTGATFESLKNFTENIQNIIQMTKGRPKFAPGGTVYGDFKHISIKGNEMVVQVDSKDGYMNDNDQYMFQND